MDTTPRPMEWSNEKILHFLELYFTETPIWNPNDMRHKDRNEVFDAWKRLEEALGFQYTITELKKKRENLMSTYRKLNNKVRASRMAGEVFKPDWFAYETMARYLNDLYESRTSKQCDEGDDPNSEFEESAQSEDDVKEFEVPVNPEHVVVNSLGQSIGSGMKIRRKRKAANEENGYDDHAKRVAEESGPDESALFCELLRVKLRGLSEALRETAFFEINNLMYQIKMQQNGGHAGHCCPNHIGGSTFRSCQRFCSFGCLPSPQQMKNTPNSRQ